MPGAPVVRKAVEFTLGAYREAQRPEAAAHPLEVAALLVEAGAPADLIAVAVLHDVVEDTRASVPEIRARFGPRIAGTVAALTENAAIGDPAERKRALRDAVAADGPAAREVFAADKVARLRAAERERRSIEPGKLDHYRRCFEMLASGAPCPRYTDELGARLHARPAQAKRLTGASRSLRTSSTSLQEEARAVIAEALQAVARAHRGRRERGNA
jgi:HD domain